MGYTLEQLEQGILAAKEQGNEQAVRALGTEYLRLAEEQNQASAPAITQAREDNGFLGNVSRGATQYGSGFNEGLANFSGMPVDGMTWILNKGIDGLNALAGTDLSQIKDPFGGSDSIKSGLTSAGTIAPPDPEFATTRKVGNYTGEGVSMALTGPLLRLPGVAGDLLGMTNAKIAQNVANAGGGTVRQGYTAGKEGAKLLAGETAASLGSVLVGDTAAEHGGDAGAYVAESLGFNPETGRRYGDTAGRVLGEFGGGMAGATAVGAGVDGLRASLSHENSEQIYDALKRQGINPSPGLVGNRSAGFMENAPGNVPLAGAPTVVNQRKQIGQFDDAVVRNVEARGGPGVQQRPTDPSTVGNRVREVANDGVARHQAEIERLEGDVVAGLRNGDQTLVDVSGSRGAIDDQIPHTDAGLADSLRAERGALERNTQEASGSLRGLLVNDLRYLETIRQNTRPGTAQHDRLTNQIEALEAQILRNRQVPMEKLRDFRSQIGRRGDSEVGLKSGQTDQVYAGVTGDIRSTMQRNSQGRAFDEMMEYERRVLADPKKLPGGLAAGGDVPYLKGLRNKDSGLVYSEVIQGGYKNPERLDAIRRNSTPEQWDDIVADTLHLMAMPNAGQRGATFEFSPNTFLTNWGNMTDQAKRVLFDDDATIGALNDLATAAKGFRERGRAGNPSGSASTAITAGAFASAGSGIMDGQVSRILANMGGIGALSASTSSEWLASIIANKHPGIADRVLARTPGRAINAATPEEEEDPGLEVTIRPPR
jgi:hypothetical protein